MAQKSSLCAVQATQYAPEVQASAGCSALAWHAQDHGWDSCSAWNPVLPGPLCGNQEIFGLLLWLTGFRMVFGLCNERNNCPPN